MTKNEQDFINYYFRNVVGKKVVASKINEAYFILRGERPTDDCNECIRQRKQKLDNTYISLCKVGGPLDVVDDEKVEALTTEIINERIKMKYPDDDKSYIIDDRSLDKNIKPKRKTKKK